MKDFLKRYFILIFLGFLVVSLVVLKLSYKTEINNEIDKVIITPTVVVTPTIVIQNDPTDI